jgi:hypothetical protein
MSAQRRPPADKVADHLHQRTLSGMPYEPAELGAVHRAGAGDVLAALSLPVRGEIYDLDSGRWSGMPVVPFHPPFILSSYRTPRGRRNQNDTAEWFGANPVNLGVNTELMVGTSTVTGAAGMTRIDSRGTSARCGPRRPRSRPSSVAACWWTSRRISA